MKFRPEVTTLEARTVPSKTTLGPKGLAAEIRLAAQTVKKEEILILHGTIAQQQRALAVLEATATQLAAVLGGAYEVVQ